MNFQILKTFLQPGQRSRLFINLLFFTILVLHPYIHPLETLGLDNNYLNCQWVQMAVFILEDITLVFFTILIILALLPRILLVILIHPTFLFSRAPPSPAS
jgi:hypothetical protein